MSIDLLLDKNHTNFRYSRLTFNVGQTSILHGFAGYFESILYDDVTLSIHPPRETPDVISWWPIFVPVMVSLVKWDALCILKLSPIACYPFYPLHIKHFLYSYTNIYVSETNPVKCWR